MVLEKERSIDLIFGQKITPFVCSLNSPPPPFHQPCDIAGETLIEDKRAPFSHL